MMHLSEFEGYPLVLAAAGHHCNGHQSYRKERTDTTSGTPQLQSALHLLHREGTALNAHPAAGMREPVVGGSQRKRSVGWESEDGGAYIARSRGHLGGRLAMWGWSAPEPAAFIRFLTEDVYM